MIHFYAISYIEATYNFKAAENNETTDKYAPVRLRGSPLDA